MKPKNFSSSNPTAARLPPSHEQIAALAHAIWQDRGCPDGCDVAHWLEAERQLGAEVRTTPVNGGLATSDDSLDPERSTSARIERALDRVMGAPAPRSPTSL